MEWHANCKKGLTGPRPHPDFNHDRTESKHTSSLPCYFSCYFCRSKGFIYAYSLALIVVRFSCHSIPCIHPRSSERSWKRRPRKKEPLSSELWIDFGIATLLSPSLNDSDLKKAGGSSHPKPRTKAMTIFARSVRGCLYEITESAFESNLC
jgi:hypothetical protein